MIGRLSADRGSSFEGAASLDAVSLAVSLELPMALSWNGTPPTVLSELQHFFFLFLGWLGVMYKREDNALSLCPFGSWRWGGGVKEVFLLRLLRMPLDHPVKEREA